MDIQCHARRISELFNDENIEARSKLRDRNENMLFADIAGVGKKAEDIIWNIMYYNFMQCYKRTSKSASPEEVSSLQLHFISGVGYYQNLLQRLALEYNLDLRLALPNMRHNFKYSEDRYEKRPNISSRVKECARFCVHRIFIHLGDIFRYLDGLGYPESRIMAVKWYEAAILFDPSNGMPYNQLGTLYGRTNYGFDAAYYYMRCVMSDEPFEGAEDNLKTGLLSNSLIFEEFEMKTSRDDLENHQLVKKCILQFLMVAKEFFIESSSFAELRIASLIQDCLGTLKSALNLTPKQNSSNELTYLSPSLIFKMGTMALMFVSNLKNNGIDSGILYSAAISFALNFMLLNVNAFVLNLNEQNGKFSFSTKEFSETMGSSLACQASSKENTPELSPRRALSRLRRRKAAVTYDNIDTNFLDFDDDSELSELEETALSTIDALEISSDISDTGSVCNGDYNFKSSDEDVSQKTSINITGINRSSSQEILRYLYLETCLPTIKIFCDWLRIDQHLLTFCLQSSKKLFSQFSDLLNTLKAIERQALNANPELKTLKYSDPSWTQKYPLTADWSLYKFRLFEKFHSDFIDFDYHQEGLTVEEMGFLCAQCLISFGNILVNK